MRHRFFVRLALLVGAVAAAGEVGAASGAARRPMACTTVAITSLHFHPRAVAPGGSATVRLRARNCTTPAQSATATWLRRFRHAGGAIPAGWPGIDPLPQARPIGPP